MIKNQIHINKEYQDLVPSQSEQEYQSLKASIKANGFWTSNPIVVNKEGIILDGHHRYRACKELQVEPITTAELFDDRLEEKLYIINNNLTRRQLNSFQRIELALKSKPILEEIAKRNSKANLKQNNNNNNNHHSHLPSVRIQTVGRVDQEIGKLAGVGKDTVRKVETILQKTPDELLDSARKGQWTIHRLYKKLKYEERRLDLINTKSVISELSAANNNIRLIHDDFRNYVIEIPDNSIDLIFVDPPYPREWVHLYSDLGTLASRVLKPGASFVTYVGRQVIHEVMDRLTAAGLFYNPWWLLAIVHSGSHDYIPRKGLFVEWKPLLWYVKGDKLTEGHLTMGDRIERSRPNKGLHTKGWDQSPIEAQHVIKGLTVENQVVLDPMMGSGTTGIAALSLKRKFIGIEIDRDEFEIAKANITLHLAKKS